AQELAKARDRQRVAALAEIDVRRLIDVLWLKRGGRRARRYCRDGARRNSGRRRAGPRRSRRRGAGSRRSRRRGRLARPAKLTGQRIEPRRELVHAPRERRQRLAQAVHLTAEALVALPGRTALDLRRDGVGVGLGTLGRLLRRRYVLANLEEILLGRDAGGFLDLGATGERQDDAEEEREPPHRSLTRAQRGLTRKCARR